MALKIIYFSMILKLCRKMTWPCALAQNSSAIMLDEGEHEPTPSFYFREDICLDDRGYVSRSPPPNNDWAIRSL